MTYTEDTLVQQTTADYLNQQLDWDSLYAHNNEDFGPESLLDRKSDKEVILARTLHQNLIELNPGLPKEAYEDAVKQITASISSQTIISTNREKYDLLRDGVQVTFHNEIGERVRDRLRVFDFKTPEKTTSSVLESYGSGATCTAGGQTLLASSRVCRFSS